MEESSKLENYKVVKRIEKIEELSGVYLKMALNKHKTVGALKFREQTEREALEEIIREVRVIEDILVNDLGEKVIE
jgi:hypothetical protein